MKTSSLIELLNEKGGISSIISKHLKIENESNSKNLSILLNFGWYIPSSFKIVEFNKLITLIKNDEYIESEILLIKFFKTNLNKIENRLINKHLNRENLIKEAFKAHKNKMYYSSTILFLSQSDGITKNKLFINSKKFNESIDFEKNPNFIEILGKESPLNVDTRKEKNINYFSDLNRHAVIHGISNDFGNEINSLKALSLLCFINDWYDRYE